MQPISCKKGLYMLYKVTFEKHNGKLVPIGEGHHKSESSLRYSDQFVRIRLGALYNQISDGPKEIGVQELPNYLLHIKELIKLPHPTIPDKIFHKAIWDVIIDEEHQRMLDEHDAINADIFLQEEQESELANQFLYDDYLVSTRDMDMANNLFSADYQQQKQIEMQLLPDKKDEDHE